jgi:hypothetical protein
MPYGGCADDPASLILKVLYGKGGTPPCYSESHDEAEEQKSKKNT